MFDDAASETGSVPAENSRELADCTDSECVLDVASSCATSTAATARRTTLEPGDGTWAADAEQPAGVP